MRIAIILFLLSICLAANSQHTIKLLIVKAEDKSPLPGASITLEPGGKTQVADSTGSVIFQNLVQGEYKVVVSFVGLEEQALSLKVPLENNAPITISMNEAEDHEEEDEVIVTSTRISRSINDIPTRVEVISGEELSEKANMKPGDIRMLLNESTGIQTQQTSATSYNSSIRIQGLDGRYTQILKDGFPLYSGFAAGLSIMQVAPLDLRQVEVIKGSSSTLYGGGAIAGLVNLVSKTPGAKRELSFLANGTSAKGLDLSMFYSQRFKRFGITTFASRNTAEPYDPADIGFTAIPKYTRHTINPRLFYYGDRSTLNIGFNYITEDRVGGSVDFIKNGNPGYFEINESKRFTAQFAFSHKLNEASNINFKSSFNRFNRSIVIPTSTFKGLQNSSFSELNYSHITTKGERLAGLNLLHDDFRETTIGNDVARNYYYTTIGAFIQNTTSPTEKLTVEAGLRADYVREFGIEVLPRASVMYKFSPAFTARLGGGLGYKTPTIFTEEAERIQFENITSIQNLGLKNERSVGGNFDINYRTRIGEVGVNINQLFFFTQLNRPLILTNVANKLQFVNSEGHIDTKGLETNIRFVYEDFKLFVGYTYADVETHLGNNKTWFPLTARHRLNNVLMYEQEGNWKLGLEGYYYSQQMLNDGSMGKPYWIFGFMVEKTWEQISLYINFENFTDTRQTRFDTIYSGTVDRPVFRDIYAPVDGFVINGGIKIRL